MKKEKKKSGYSLYAIVHIPTAEFEQNLWETQAIVYIPTADSEKKL